MQIIIAFILGIMIGLSWPKEVPSNQVDIKCSDVKMPEENKNIVDAFKVCQEFNMIFQSQIFSLSEDLIDCRSSIMKTEQDIEYYRNRDCY